jgi:predicted MPP superfamily phosphohydrolase
MAALERRLGHAYLRRRLGLEQAHEARALGRMNGCRPYGERWYSKARLIRTGLGLMGLRRRGRRNALSIELRRNEVAIASLPAEFDGYTILHLSDLHADIAEGFTEALVRRVQGLRYDLCVLTGDYRARTFGPHAAALAALESLRGHLTGPAYAILGNHDTVRLVPAMEAMGYRLLVNEWTRIERGDAAIYLSGIDDAHHYRTVDFHRAARAIPREAASILLSHTPEAYRRAARAGFDLMLSGHTHGGQVCLPGGVPLMTDAGSPRSLVRGPWRHRGMAGYTSAGVGCSIVDVRVNCPPEVTLHRLRRGVAAP